MSGDDTARALYAILAIMLVASSLAVRRLPMSDIVKMGLIWVAIFAGMFFVFQLLQVLGVDFSRFG
jgi:hypothetical protein